MGLLKHCWGCVALSLQVIVSVCVLRELLGQATIVPSSVRSSARDRSCSSVLGLQESLRLPGAVLSPHSAGALPTS